MSILETIKQQKLKEVDFLKQKIPVKQLEQSEFFERKIFSLKENLMKSNSSGIIAEFKRKSPSKGNINIDADVEAITSGYEKAGAACISVLTDKDFFGARENDFSIARKVNLPILRKDFIVDEYQILQSKAMGADVLLLIAKMLTVSEIEKFSQLAKSLGMEILLETHSKEEIFQNEKAEVDFFGINNRDLNNFDTKIENSIKLAGFLPKNALKIAESGIEDAETVQILKKNGFSGFLIGETFMKAQNPAQKYAEFISELNFSKTKK